MRLCWLTLPLSIAAVGCSAPGALAPAAVAPRTCFWSSEVTGFTDAGPDRAILNSGSRDSWELTLSPGCPDVDWALNIGIRARNGQAICPGRPAELIVPDAGGTGARTCLVRSIRRLPPQR